MGYKFQGFVKIFISWKKFVDRKHNQATLLAVCSFSCLKGNSKICEIYSPRKFVLCGTDCIYVNEAFVGKIIETLAQYNAVSGWSSGCVLRVWSQSTFQTWKHEIYSFKSFNVQQWQLLIYQYLNFFSIL